MKEIKVSVNTWYVVEGTAGATVINPSTNKPIATVENGKQTGFLATTPYVLVSDDSVQVVKAPFNHAPAFGSGSGGGIEIKFDTKPTSGSTNAVTSGGLYDILYGSSTRFGRGATAESYSVTIGDGAWTGMGAISLGKNAGASGGNAVVLGAYSKATKDYTSVLGSTLALQDEGCVLIGAWNKARTQVVQLYLICGDTPLANTYEDNAACLGYVVKDASGNIIACGTRKLSELLTNNTAFAPASMDLDADPPTPFLPTGIMEPIELPEDLTE